jgi:hypothetical protein
VGRARGGYYYDSRWTLPLAWFFFFRPEDVRLIDVHYGGSQWQEVRLSAEKGSALEVFEHRKPLLMSIVGHGISGEAVTKFILTVDQRPGRYLLMDPDEVLGGISCGFEDDRGHAERIANILVVLGDGTGSADEASEITGPYVKEFSADPDKFECQILGFTYW